MPRASSESVMKSMKSNRGKNTRPEILLRSALWTSGIRGYRLHRKGIPGRPDISFGNQRVAVFVNGCYWHRCPKCSLPLPKTHMGFWTKKFELNVKRDERKITELEADGWLPLVIWECEIKNDIDKCVERVRQALRAR